MKVKRIRIPKIARVMLLLCGAITGWVVAGWMQLQSATAHADSAAEQHAKSHAASAPTRPSAVSVESLPASRGGQDLIGKPMPDLHLTRWLNATSQTPASGKVTLYRWWTEGCPYCETTLPALETLRKKYAADGLQVVAVYHPKPRGPIKDERILAAAAERHYAGAIAVDEDWSALDRVWLKTGDRAATSVSFLVDSAGVIRFVHPGLAYFPSEGVGDSQQDTDYRLLEAAIAILVHGQ